MAKDYYQVLGVDKKSSKDEIKQAFRKLAHKYHPDKSGGDEAKFKEVNEAYGILSDDKKRAEYDSYGRVFGDAGAGAGQGFGGFDFSSYANGGGFEFDIGDLFGDFFGGGSSRSASRRRGRDISIDVELSFEDSIFGVERNILVNKVSKCDDCSGTGGERGTDFKTCDTCGGNGSIREVKRSVLGSFATQRVCDACQGKGKIPENKCNTCHGEGVKKGEKEIKVKIPAGIENGEMIRLTQAGEAVAGGTPGDLYIKVHVHSHQFIKKDGVNLRTELNIKITDALLGAKYTIKTLDGTIDLKVPAGVAHHEILKIKNKGVPRGDNSRGDFLVRVNIQFPQKLSKKVKKLVEELREEGI